MDNLDNLDNLKLHFCGIEMQNVCCGLVTPHGLDRAESGEKVEKMINHLRSGGTLPPILANGDQALSGTHRLAAYELIGEIPDIVQVDDAHYEAACDECGGYELEAVCNYLHNEYNYPCQ